MRKASRIKINQVFRVHLGSDPQKHDRTLSNYGELTTGAHQLGANVNKGIWAYAAVHEPEGENERRPAVILHSNPLKAESVETPWIDVIDPEEGRATYHGDNRQPDRDYGSAPGNRLLLSLLPLYSDPSLRVLAPPMLLFRQVAVEGSRKGFREFCGYGIPESVRVQVQRGHEAREYFANLAVDLTLFSLASESEFFDWEWIDKRRDSRLSSEQTMRWAPAAWRRWVAGGASTIERCRRSVSRQGTRSAEAQSPGDNAARELLVEIVADFEDRKHEFEGLASLLATRVFGRSCSRLWVTKRSGDGGIDFVCRQTIGLGPSSIPLIVLGQAKCLQPGTATGGKDLARVVARLQRGWVGVFVTTGYFSRAAQSEAIADRYPLLLIDGAMVAAEVQKILAEDGISLRQLLDREAAWYDSHVRPIDPSRAAHITSDESYWMIDETERRLHGPDATFSDRDSVQGEKDTGVGSID